MELEPEPEKLGVSKTGTGTETAGLAKTRTGTETDGQMMEPQVSICLRYWIHLSFVSNGLKQKYDNGFLLTFIVFNLNDFSL